MLAAHWRRSGFGGSLFQPAVTGWYPKRGSEEAHLEPLLAEPWPGIPVRGCHASRRAELNWLPIAPGLTPHSLRHAHKTLIKQLSSQNKLMDERMGHEDGSVQARYSRPGRSRNAPEPWAQVEVAVGAQDSLGEEFPDDGQ